MTMKSLNELKDEMRAVAAGEREPSPLPVQLSEELKIIQKMIAIYDTPEKWTQGVVARDKEGKPISWNDDNAFCFCIIGALGVAENDNIPASNKIMNRLTAHVNIRKFNTVTWNVSVWNDYSTTKFENVVELLKKVEKDIQDEIKS